MFPQIRRLLRHALVYGLGNVLSRVVSFILLPYLTHNLNPEQYGAVTLLYTFISIGMVLYAYGADIAFLRYFILEPDEQRRRQIYGTIFWATTITSTVFSIVTALAAGALSGIVFDDPAVVGADSRYLVLLAAALLMSDTLLIYPYLWMRATEKSLPFIGLKTSGAILHVGMTVVFLSVFHRGLAGIFEANLIASLLQLIILLPTVLRQVDLRVRWQELGEYIRFGLPNIPSQLFVLVVELASRKILEIMMGLAVVGLFSAGYKLGLFMAVVTMGFRFAWQPFFLSMADREDAKETFARVFTYFLLVTGSLFLLLTTIIEPLMKMPLPLIGTLIEERYWAGLKVFPVILLAHICNGAYANFMVGVYLKKKTYLMPLITGTAAAVNVGVCVAFIPVFGMMAAAWATLLAYLTVAVMLYFMIRPHYPVAYEWRRVLILLGCGAIVFGVSKTPLFENHWSLKLLMVPAFFVLLKIANFFLPEEIAAVRRRLFPSRVN